MESRREFHPVSMLFPPLAESERRALADDIKTRGQLQPIWVHPDGRIIDGRHRYDACLEVGIEPQTAEWCETEHGDLISFVLSCNLNRRQLTPKQRVLLAARIADFKPGDHDTQICASFTQAQAAKVAGCSKRSVQSACKVLNHGIPKLITLVEAGQVSVSSAERVADESPGEQAKIATGGPHGIKEFARASRAASRGKALKGVPAEDAVRVSLADDQRAGAQPQTMPSVLETVVPAGKYSVIVAEPPWNGHGAPAGHENVPGKPGTMDPQSISNIVERHAAQWAHTHCVFCVRTNKYWLDAAIATLENSGFDFLFPVLVLPRHSIASESGSDAPHHVILIGIRGDIGTLDAQGLMRWMDRRRRAEPEESFDINDLARHLSRGPVLEVAWSDADTGGGRG